MSYIVTYGGSSHGYGYSRDEVWADRPWNEAGGIKGKTAYTAGPAYNAGHWPSGNIGNGAHGG